MPIAPQYPHRSQSRSSSLPQRGLRNRASSRNKKKTYNLVESIEKFIADIKANFEKKKPQKQKYTQNTKKQSAPIYSDDLYDELELWLLRLDSVFESLTDKLNGALEILKRRIFQFSPEHRHSNNHIANPHPEEKVDQLTAEIDQIFGENVIRFRSSVKSHKVLIPSKRMSANELRDELERLLRGNKS